MKHEKGFLFTTQDRLNRLEDELRRLLPLEELLPRTRQEVKEVESREQAAREELVTTADNQTSVEGPSGCHAAKELLRIL